MSNLKIGTLAYATNQGLGILAREFYRNGIINDVLVVRHAHYKNHFEWYPNSQQVPISPRFGINLAKRFCQQLDVLFCLETPFEWNLFRWCKEYNVKTVLMTMYECTKDPMPRKPDLILCPSQLDHRYFPEGIYLPVPVEVPWRPRERARVFVHNAGNGGLLGRNGTGSVIDAMKFVKSPIKLILRTQRPLQWGVNDPRVEVRVGTIAYEDLWQEGDVFLFPEKFNGLSLPLQEARAAGMLVMGSRRFPMTEWLPEAPLIPVASYQKNRIGGCYQFDEAIVSPQDIAAHIDAWYDQPIAKYSEQGYEWARTMSWEALKPRYMGVLSK